MSLFALTNIYSVEIHELGVDLINKNQSAKIFHDDEGVRASITCDPLRYMSNQEEPAHACLSKQWLPEIKEKLSSNQSINPLFLIIEKASNDDSLTIDTIRCSLNHEFDSRLRSVEPLFQRSGNPIAAQEGRAELLIGSTIKASSRFLPRVGIPEASLDEKLDVISKVIPLLQDISEVTCMDEPLVTILNRSFESQPDPKVFLQMWEIMNDGMGRSGVVSHLGCDCKDRWLSPRTKRIDKDHPSSMTELQREFRNALAHMDMQRMDKIIKYVNKSNSEKLKDIYVNNHVTLTRMMIQSLQSDIFQFLLGCAKNCQASPAALNSS